jgi:UDP-3-O-[3-hydroxymyristoyl] glucosamine N-acyltransferase
LAVIAAEDLAPLIAASVIVAGNPRLAFARAVARYFEERPPPIIAATAIIPASATIGPGVDIGHYSVIGEGVSIGAGTRIGNHVSIGPGTRIGARCVIKSHAVIGEHGYAFEMSEEGKPIHLPHVGGVHIGDDVEVGSFTTIVRGTIGDTILSDHAKIDDHVHIAHNVRIGEGAFVIANAEVSGSVDVGARAWIAPQASILNGLSIGEDAVVGLGAVVTRSVASGDVVVGNPARVIRSEDSNPESP